MKVKKLTYGEGFTKMVLGYDKPVKIYNEADYILTGKEDLPEIHNKLREEVALLNQKELDEFLKNV